MTQSYRFECGCSWRIIGPPEGEGITPCLDFDVRKAPLDCKATWNLLGRGETKGVFQLESSLGKTWCRKLKPENIGHMGALGAILRPGCIKVKDAEGISTTQHYCRRKNGEEPIRGYHPAVDPILLPTYNVLIYQEQAMAIARAVAGFSLQDADVLRKACAKKLPEEMAKVKTMFIEGAAKAQVVSVEQAAEIFAWIQESQRYSFNGSHAISYGVMGYYSAYIKAHFPLAFFTAWLSMAKENQDPKEEIYQLVQEARLFDISVEIPDLRDLQGDFYNNGKIVKFGLTSISGLGEARLEKSAAAVRELENTFGCKLGETSWLDFLCFVAPRMSSEVVRGLIYAGALRWIKLGRRMMEAEYLAWCELSDKELEWMQTRNRLARGVQSFADVVAPPEKPTAPPALLPPYSKEYEKALKKHEKAFAKWLLEQESWTQKEQASKQPLTSVVEALKAVAKPKSEGGGCANPSRIEKLLSQVQLLEHPPSSLQDNPQWLAWAEEQILGISLSCSEMDSCDTSQVNCSCKEFLAGREGFLMFGVKLESVREVKTKNGKSAGSKMAFLSISDDTCMLDNVVCFPDKYKDCKEHLIEKNLVILQGERAEKDNTLMVTKVWPATQIVG